MRALKSVLVMAGSLKRAAPDLNEDIVLIRSMRDSNIPKFLSEDARLFNAIVSDLFPDVEIPDQVWRLRANVTDRTKVLGNPWGAVTCPPEVQIPDQVQAASWGKVVQNRCRRASLRPW